MLSSRSAVWCCKLICLFSLALSRPVHADETVTIFDIPYVASGDPRQTLDIYRPKSASGLPVVFWIHGGGWQAGDKSDVQLKPQMFCDQGFLFISTNYRLLPAVDMRTLITDVAKAVGWVHTNIKSHGGDPNRIMLMGHSAGAQLAAILATDHRYLQAENVPLAALRGCVPVDGDTYDIPAIIATAEMRQTFHGLPLPENGHRVKFGNDPKLHREFSAVSHVQAGRNIPPFLILYVSNHPDVAAQAKRLALCLQAAEIDVQEFAARETTHTLINARLGEPNDEPTNVVLNFINKYRGEP